MVGKKRNTRATSVQPHLKKGKGKASNRAARVTASPEPTSNRSTRASTREPTPQPTRSSNRLRGFSADPEVKVPDTNKRKRTTKTTLSGSFDQTENGERGHLPTIPDEGEEGQSPKKKTKIRQSIEGEDDEAKYHAAHLGEGTQPRDEASDSEAQLEGQIRQSSSERAGNTLVEDAQFALLDSLEEKLNQDSQGEATTANTPVEDPQPLSLISELQVVVEQSNSGSLSPSSPSSRSEELEAILQHESVEDDTHVSGQSPSLSPSHSAEQQTVAQTAPVDESGNDDSDHSQSSSSLHSQDPPTVAPPQSFEEPQEFEESDGSKESDESDEPHGPNRSPSPPLSPHSPEPNHEAKTQVASAPKTPSGWLKGLASGELLSRKAKRQRTELNSPAPKLSPRHPGQSSSAASDGIFSPSRPTSSLPAQPTTASHPQVVNLVNDEQHAQQQTAESAPAAAVDGVLMTSNPSSFASSPPTSRADQAGIDPSPADVPIQAAEPAPAIEQIVPSPGPSPSDANITTSHAASVVSKQPIVLTRKRLRTVEPIDWDDADNWNMDAQRKFAHELGLPFTRDRPRRTAGEISTSSMMPQPCDHSKTHIALPDVAHLDFRAWKRASRSDGRDTSLIDGSESVQGFITKKELIDTFVDFTKFLKDVDTGRAISATDGDKIIAFIQKYRVEDDVCEAISEDVLAAEHTRAAERDAELAACIKDSAKYLRPVWDGYSGDEEDTTDTDAPIPIISPPRRRFNLAAFSNSLTSTASRMFSRSTGGTNQSAASLSASVGRSGNSNTARSNRSRAYGNTSRSSASAPRTHGNTPRSSHTYSGAPRTNRRSRHPDAVLTGSINKSTSRKPQRSATGQSVAAFVDRSGSITPPVPAGVLLPPANRTDVIGPGAGAEFSGDSKHGPETPVKFEVDRRARELQPIFKMPGSWPEGSSPGGSSPGGSNNVSSPTTHTVVPPNPISSPTLTRATEPCHASSAASSELPSIKPPASTTSRSRKFKLVRKVVVHKYYNSRSPMQFGYFHVGPWNWEVRLGGEIKIDRYQHVKQWYVYDEELKSARFTDEVSDRIGQPYWSQEEEVDEAGTDDERDDVDDSNITTSAAEGTLSAKSPIPSSASDRSPLRDLQSNREKLGKFKKYIDNYQGEDPDISEHIRKQVWALPESEIDTSEWEAELAEIRGEAWAQHTNIWKYAQGGGSRHDF